MNSFKCIIWLLSYITLSNLLHFSYEVKRKHSFGNKHVNERQKLRYKHKKEFKVVMCNYPSIR